MYYIFWKIIEMMVIFVRNFNCNENLAIFQLNYNLSFCLRKYICLIQDNCCSIYIELNHIYYEYFRK